MAEAEQVVTAWVRSESGGATCGLQKNAGSIPTYADSQGRAPDICASARRVKEVAQRCRAFYNSLQGRSGEAVCPWGLRISYATVENPEQHFGLFMLQGPDEVTAGPAQIAQGLPRKVKKAAGGALVGTESHEFKPIGSEDLLSQFPAVIDTLLAGRASEAIRAVAHEVQSPVQGAFSDALNFMEFAKRGQLPPDAERKATRLVQNVQSISTLAKRLPFLLASDLEFSPGQLRKVKVHLEVDRIFERLQVKANEKRVELRREYNHGPEDVEAVPDHLHLVLENVISNAVKYSFSGRSGAQDDVLVGFKKRGDALEISIRNRGCPITEEELRAHRIFEMGYRGKFSTDRDRRGTGAGLYLARRLTRAHGGEIDVSSTAVGGAKASPVAEVVFRVLWPIHQPEDGQQRLPLG